MGAAAISDTGDNTVAKSRSKRFFAFVFYPLIYVFRKIFRRSKTTSLASTKPSSPAKNQNQAVAQSSNDPDEIWSEMRLTICERLWGDGCLNPFTAEYLIGALRLLNVDESNSILQLGSGLGGTTRAMVDQLGVWITGYEIDEDLLEIAKMRNKMAGMSKKAAISKFRPDAPKLKEKGFNGALLYESLTLIEDKTTIIKDVAKSLRANGHFIMIDYVLPSGEPPNPTVLSWYTNEPIKPKLWTARRTYDSIKDAGLDVRIAEDFTANYRTMVLTGWLNLLSGLSKKELTPEFAEALIKECEYWIYRIGALDSGGLKVYRYHAIKD